MSQFNLTTKQSNLFTIKRQSQPLGQFSRSQVLHQTSTASSSLFLHQKKSTVVDSSSQAALTTAVVPVQIQKEVAAITSILSDVKAHDWKTRIEQFDRLKLLFMQLCNEHAEDPGAQQRAVATVMRQMQSVIIVQINDLRSTVAKHACNFITWMSQEFPEQFGSPAHKAADLGSVATQNSAACGGNGIRYFREDALFKLVGNGNKTLSDLGHTTIVDILSSNSCMQKIAPYLCAQMKSKSPLVRQRTAQYFEMFIDNYDSGTISADSDLIDLFLTQATSDQSQDVRQQARKCFAAYRSKCRDQSTILLLHGIQELQVRKQIMHELDLDVQELQAELQEIEQAEIQASEQYLDAQIGDDNFQSLSATPMKDKLRHIKSQFEEAKTPEQFMRAKLRASAARSPLPVKSPIKQERELCKSKTATRTQSHVNRQNSNLHLNQLKTGEFGQLFGQHDTRNYFQNQNHPSRRTTTENFGNFTSRDPIEQPRFLTTQDDHQQPLNSSRPEYNSQAFNQFQTSVHTTQEHQDLDLNLEQPQILQECDDDSQLMHLVSIHQESVQKASSNMQRSKSSIAMLTNTSSKLKQMQRKYTPNKDRSAFKRPAGNHVAKRIQLDLTSQEQRNSRSRNQSQCGSLTQRCNSKIGMGLRNLGMTQTNMETPKVTRIQKEVLTQQPRPRSTYQIQQVKSAQLNSTEKSAQQRQRRVDEQSPLPFGKSPRPEQASPRLDNLRFQKADQIQPSKSTHNFNRTTVQQQAQKNQGICVFKSPKSSERQRNEKQNEMEPAKDPIKENEKKKKVERAKAQRSKRVAVDLEHSKSRETTERNMKSKTQIVQKSHQVQDSTPLTPAQQTLTEPKPLTASEQLQQYSTKLDFVIQESKGNISSDFLKSLLDQLLKHLTEQPWTLEEQELITNVHCQLFSVLCIPQVEARNVVQLVQSLIIKTYELILSQCNEESEDFLKSETLLRLMKPLLSSQTTVAFDKVKDIAMKTGLSTMTAALEPNGRKAKSKLKQQFQMLLKLVDDLVAFNHKKADHIVQIIALLLQSCLKEDELVSKQKDLLSRVFDFVVDLLLEAYSKQSQSVVNEDNDASVEVSEEQPSGDMTSDQPSGVDILLSIIQKFDKKVGSTKDLFIKLKKQDADQYWRISAIVKRSSNLFITRILKDIQKQGFFGQNKSLTIVQNVKRSSNLSSNVTGNFTWHKPNIEGAVSHYNYRRLEQLKLEQLRKEARKEEAHTMLTNDKGANVDQLQQSDIKGSNTPLGTYNNSDGKEQLQIVKPLSPPKSMAHGYVKILSQNKEKTVEEEKSSLNNEILRQAQPVTSVLNFADDHEPDEDPETLRDNKQTSRTILEETIIVQAPWNIEELVLTDAVNEEYKHLKEKEATDSLNITDNYSKGRSTTTRSGSPKQIGRKTKKFQFTRQVSLVNWKECIGLDENQDYDDDFVMNVVLEKLKDPTLKINGVIVSTIFQEFVESYLSSFKLKDLDEMQSERDPFDQMAELIYLFELSRQFPQVHMHVQSKSFLEKAVQASLQCQIRINDYNKQFLALESDSLLGNDSEESVFEMFSSLVINFYDVPLANMIKHLEKLLLQSLELLRNERNLVSLKPAESNHLLVCLNIIHITTRLIFKFKQQEDIKESLKAFLTLLLEVRASDFIDIQSDISEPASLANHTNTHIRREAANSLKKLKVLVKSKAHKDLLRLVSKY